MNLHQFPRIWAASAGRVMCSQFIPRFLKMQDVSIGNITVQGSNRQLFLIFDHDMIWYKSSLI